MVCQRESRSGVSTRVLDYPALPCLYCTCPGTPCTTPLRVHHRCTAAVDVIHALTADGAGAGVVLWAQAGLQGLGKPLLLFNPAQSCHPSSRVLPGVTTDAWVKNGQRLDRTRARTPLIALRLDSSGESPAGGVLAVRGQTASCRTTGG